MAVEFGSLVGGGGGGEEQQTKRDETNSRLMFGPCGPWNDGTSQGRDVRCGEKGFWRPPGLAPKKIEGQRYHEVSNVGMRCKNVGFSLVEAMERSSFPRQRRTG